MPYINVDEVYILNNTGLQVDQVVDSPYVDAGFTDTQKERFRKNIAAGGSNPNLLDNWYFVGGGSQLGDGVFPINQRGQASYSGSGNIFDRWTLQNAFANLAADAVYFGSTTQNVWGLMQQAPSCFRNLWGKTVTVSAIINNDELVQETYTIPSSGAFDMPAAGSGGVFVNLYSFDGSNIVFRIYTQYTASYHIKAVKLELGTVSTLANDVPPNFTEELMKCQHYLWQQTFPSNIQLGVGSAVDTSQVVISIPLPTPMRKGNVICSFTASVMLIGAGSIIVAAAVTAADVRDNHLRLIVTAASAVTQYTLYSFFTSTDTTMTVSAEL